MLAFFIGLGIEVFYPNPKAPEYPAALQYAGKAPSQLNPEQLKMQQDYDSAQKDFMAKNSIVSRNTSIVAVVFSIIILILSLTILLKTDIMSDGFLLGGLFTLLYGIIRGFMSDNSKFRFLMVSVGLLVALVLGYIKFIRPKESSGKPR